MINVKQSKIDNTLLCKPASSKVWTTVINPLTSSPLRIFDGNRYEAIRQTIYNIYGIVDNEIEEAISY